MDFGSCPDSNTTIHLSKCTKMYYQRTDKLLFLQWHYCTGCAMERCRNHTNSKYCVKVNWSSPSPCTRYRPRNLRTFSSTDGAATLDKNLHKSPGKEVRKRKDTTGFCSGMCGIDSEDGATDDLGSVKHVLQLYMSVRECREHPHLLVVENI